MASVLCNNQIDIDIVQKSAFYIPKRSLNPFIDCKSTHSVDPSLWQNQTIDEKCLETLLTTNITSNSTSLSIAVQAVTTSSISDLAQVLTAIFTVLSNQLTAAQQKFAPALELLSANPAGSVTAAPVNLQSAVIAFTTSASAILPAQYTSVSLTILFQSSNERRKRRQIG
jgi:hypothetical protein